MATFLELVKTGKAKGTYLKKQALVGSVHDELVKIGSLDKENPNLHIFEMTQEEAKALLADLTKAKRDLKLALIEQNPEIYEDGDYKKDTNSDIILELKVQTDLERYIEVMNQHEIQYPPVVAPIGPQGDLNDILTALLKCQTGNAAAADVVFKTNTAQQIATAKQHKEMIDTLSKHGTSGPKASQPFFTPKNSDADYEIYSEFIQRFSNFVIKCTDEVKLQWLQSCVKGDALLIIKHLTPSDANYKTALERLEKRFNNPEVIKHNLVQSILSFKADSNPRFTKVVSAVTGFANALEELRTKHIIDNDVKMLEEFKREILFYNLPAPIREGLILATGENFLLPMRF